MSERLGWVPKQWKAMVTRPAIVGVSAQASHLDFFVHWAAGCKADWMPAFGGNWNVDAIAFGLTSNSRRGSGWIVYPDHLLPM